MKQPRRGPKAASPLKGATPAARQSRFRGVPRLDVSCVAVLLRGKG